MIQSLAGEGPDDRGVAMKPMLLKPLLMATAIAVLACAEPASPPIPSGLWQSKEEGFVIRIEACGSGFCGFAAGAPKDKKPPGDKKKPEEGCGKQMLRDFVWNEKSKRWEGFMQPPGSSAKLSAYVKTDGKSFLTLTAKVFFLSKTMSFAAFTGKIGNGCKIL